MTAESQILTELREIRIENREMKAQLNILSKYVVDRMPAWMTLKEACEFKGVKYNTVRLDARKQPKFGQWEWASESGKQKKWCRKTITEWISVMNDWDILEYAKAYPAEYAMIK